MVSSRRFTFVLAGWAVALFAALAGFVWSVATPDLGAVRLVAGLLVMGAAFGLWRHVARTNNLIAHFVSALRFGDFSTRFDTRDGAGFGAIGAAFNDAIRTLQGERDRSGEELRFLQALTDDLPVALLTVDEVHGVQPANKAARLLFDRHQGVRPEDFALYGATFAARLAAPRAMPAELLILRLGDVPQRAIVRMAALERLGVRTHAVTIEPVQTAIDTIEMAAQSDLVRVLTHEILNSLTPVVSLAQTAADVLETEPADLATARLATATLLRRTTGLRTFIDSYRMVARPPAPRTERFAATAFADEIARLFAAEWPALRFVSEVDATLTLEADPDLLAQALINLVRNAAQAVATRADGTVWLTIRREGNATLIEIADNGPGVPDAIQRDVFLPFFTTRAEGTGVGLNLVRQIAIAHGGSVGVENREGGGALFRLRW
ncbi:MAG TPA: ATP-binding protein [Sphingomonas sp.]|nr:ATP-binding protein [Sphingomonas sp.]